MSIKVISNIEPAGDGFKVADAKDLSCKNKINDNGAEVVTTVQEMLDDIVGVIKSTSKLQYSDDPAYIKGVKQYWTIGDTMYLKFKFVPSLRAQGSCTITITRDGVLYKQFTSNTGDIIVDLGKATEFKEYKYVVSGIDSSNNAAESEDGSTLTFVQVSGGVALSSNVESIIGTTTFALNTPSKINVPFTISYAEKDKDKMIDFNIYKLNDDGTQTTFFTASETYNNGLETFESTTYILNEANGGITFTEIGNYKLTLRAKINIGSISNPEYIYSTTIEVPFSVLEANSISITKLTDFPTTPDNDTPLSIAFRISTNVPSLLSSNTLAADGKIYKVYKDGTQELYSSITFSPLSRGDNKTWIIGKLPVIPDGKYKVTIEGKPFGGGSITGLKSILVEEYLTIKQSEEIGSTYETEGLIAYFNPNEMDNAGINPDKFLASGTPKNATNSYYYLKLHDFNFSTNGYIVDDTAENGKMLKFTGDTYAEMIYVNEAGSEVPYKPMDIMVNNDSGYTFEILCRSRCIGEMDARIASCNNRSIPNYGGFDITYEKASCSSNNKTTTATLSEDTWNHIVFVVNKKVTGTVKNSEIENYNPVATMRVYINGVLTSCTTIDDNDEFYSSSKPSMQLLLNTSNVDGKISSFGTSEIKLIRLYSRALNSKMILNNYINSFYNKTDRDVVKTKNDVNATDMPVVYFVRNKFNVYNPDTGKYGYEYGLYSEDKSFEIMHRITSKISTDTEPNNSKNTWVNCTMWYRYKDKDGEWKIKHYDDVDVYLQGTSTLVFPIKNYKIKMFSTAYSDDYKIKKKDSEGNKITIVGGSQSLIQSTDEEGNPTGNKFVAKNDRGEKLKIIPPNVDDTDGWHCKDSTFTLKCDYMEQSHKNNTPTAEFFNDLVDKLCENNESLLSPAKYEIGKINYSVTNETGQTITKEDYKCRDAIMGFPCLVYYNENNKLDDMGNPIGDFNESGRNNQQGYTGDDSDVYVGSYMFNTDKTSNSLGFEIDTDEYTVVDSDGNTAVDNDGVEIKCSIKPCVSLEGSTNSSEGAASFQDLTDYHNSIYDTYINSKTSEFFKWKYPDKDPSDYDQEEFNKYEDIIYKAVNDSSYFNSESMDSDVKTWINSLDTPISEKEAYIRTNGYVDDEGNLDWIKYILTTFEYRWTYVDDVLSDDYNVDDAIIDKLSLNKIKDAIQWIHTATNSSDPKTAFRNGFNNYFSFEYCLAYYLNMMVFNQVDSAGKNAMFDTWGGKIYPRPYDMDTQVGLSNNGEDIIHVASEINPELSPRTLVSRISGIDVSASGYDQMDSHTRYTSFNTKNSRLWISFGKYFSEEIHNKYTELRDAGIIDADYISNYVEARTSDVIGESFYNKDGAAKYLTQVSKSESGEIINNMLRCLQGNRDSRYKYYMQQRITFLDTFFNYTGSKSDNKQIEIRSNVPFELKRNYGICGISVYSPCYVTIKAGTDFVVTTYIDTSSTYEYNGETYEGVLFRFPLAADDKDWTISSAGNIKSINHMNNLALKSIDLQNARKLTSINITSNKSLTALVIGANPYLRSINLKDSELVGTGKEADTLNCSICENLQYLDISNTKITNVNLPNGGNLKSFAAANCNLTKAEFTNLQFLETIDLENCNNILQYNIDTCNKITNVALDGFIKLNSVSIKNCDGITSLDLSNTMLQKLEIINCDNLSDIDLSSSKGMVLNNLNLSTAYGLKKLNISNAIPDKNDDGDVYIDIRFPYYSPEYKDKTDEEKQSAINSGIDIRWRELTELTATTSALRGITYGLADNSDHIADFNYLTNLTKLLLQGCIYLVSINNLKYKGDLHRLFKECRALKTISNSTLTASTYDVSEIFYRCDVLSDLGTCTFTSNSGTTVTNASYAFYTCQMMDFDGVKQFLTAYPKLTNISSIFQAMARGCKDSNGDQIYFTIDNTLFKYNTALTNASLAFYSTPIKKVSAGIFDSSKNTMEVLHGTFCSCTDLESVDGGIFKNLIKLKSVDDCFYRDQKIETFFNKTYGYDIFYKNSDGVNLTLTDTSGMFCDCARMKIGTEITLSNKDISTVKDIFNGLQNLKLTHAMFDACEYIGIIPEGLLETNTNLQNMAGMFANNGLIEEIPNSLFYSNDNIPIKTTHSNLTNMSGVFWNCRGMEGTIKNNFFKGAENVTNIGYFALTGDYSLTGGPDYRVYGGIFGNTSISKYESNFMKPLKNVTNISYLFTKCFQPTIRGSNISTMQNLQFGSSIYIWAERKSHSLAGENANSIYWVKPKGDSIYKAYILGKSVNSTAAGSYFDKTQEEIDAMVTKGEIVLVNDALQQVVVNDKKTGMEISTSGMYSNMFENNTKLTNAKYCFAGNTGFDRFIDTVTDGITHIDESPYLFKNNPNITNLEALFAFCSLQYPIYVNIFKNLKKLQNASIAFIDNKEMQGNINEDIFENCTTLSTVLAMFYNCNKLGNDTQNGSDNDISTSPNISIPVGIFDSCRSTINNVSYMFGFCGFNGTIGTGEGELKRTESTDDDGNIITTVETIVSKNGLLAECTNLTTVKGMFIGCTALKGAIPHDMFFSKSKTYSRLTDMSYLFDGCYFMGMYTDELDSGNAKYCYDVKTIGEDEYFIPENWMNRCERVTTIHSMFKHVAGVPSSVTTGGYKYYGSEENKNALILSNNTFVSNNKISQIDYLMFDNQSLGGTYNNMLLQSSLNVLQTATYAFCYCPKIKSFGNSAETAIFVPDTLSKQNRALQKIDAVFYACTGLTNKTYLPVPIKSNFSAMKTYTHMAYGCDVANKNDLDNTAKQSITSFNGNAFQVGNDKIAVNSFTTLLS